MRLYAFGTLRSRLPGSPVVRWYRAGAHYAVLARYLAQVPIRTAAGPCELPGPRFPPLCTLTVGGS
eukprot:439304-Rhodomonas_salina.1